MGKGISKIVAEDCSCFKDIGKNENTLKDFIKNFLNNSVLNFSTKHRNENVNSFEEEPFASYNYKDKNWYAGRWVGTANFEKFSIEIKPRFGDIVFFSMLDEIFSINILENFSNPQKTNLSDFFKRLIPFIWTKKLGAANKYGVPKHYIVKSHQGKGIKGKMDIRRSIFPYFVKNEVVSIYKEKIIDETIAQIILHAKTILEKKWSNPNFYRNNENAYNAILNFESAVIYQKKVTKLEFDRIRYKVIYQSFKDIVDFSWNIIKNKNYNQEVDLNNKGYCLFVDMAEIWELYLLSILKREFQDWSIESPVLKIYENYDFKKTLIPDIVMSKGNDVVIFDAKWKNMKYNSLDFDRADFHQIHTYISYYQNIEKKNVIAGGLLYPISKEYKKQKSDGLFGHNNSTKFIVDGIDLSRFESTNLNMKELTEEEAKKQMKEFDNQEKAFIDRINNILN